MITYTVDLIGESDERYGSVYDLATRDEAETLGEWLSDRLGSAGFVIERHLRTQGLELVPGPGLEFGTIETSETIVSVQVTSAPSDDPGNTTILTEWEY